MTTLSGVIVATNIGPYGGSGTYQDTNGNELTVNNSTSQYFDTLSGTTAVLTQAGSGTPSSPMTYTYTAPSTAPASYTMNYLQYTVATGFSVSGIADYGRTSNALVSSIQLPDGTEYQFTYEITPGSCTPLADTQPTCVTGRIYQVTLPTLGTITYTYGGGSHGIYSDGSTAGVTRALTATTTAPAQSWSYTRTLVTGSPAPGSTWTTTVTDPSSNQTVINFAEDGATQTSTTAASYNFYETQRKIYQGSISSNSCSSTITNNCLLLTTVKCYNAHYSGCATATVSSPITQTDAYSELLNGSTRLSQVLYNGYGLVTGDKEYNYGVALGAAPSSSYLVRETSIIYNTNLNNNIVNRPSSISVYDWTSGSQVTLQALQYIYDGGTLQTTTGTPQQVSITGSRGNLTALTTYSSGTKFLDQTSSYYDTGNVYQTNDVNGAQTTYTYGACGNSFPTLISEPLSVSRSLTWNCTGGVATQITDENGNNVTSNYTEADFWRPSSTVDQMSNQTNITYSGQIAVETALQNFNGGNSASDFRTTVDGFGRMAFGQRLQAPGSENYDTSETDYNNLGQPYISRMPYSATASPSSENTSAPGTTTTYDALGRVFTVTDGDGGTVKYAYTNNDVVQTVGGTSGTQQFQKQFEYDGLGG